MTLRVISLKVDDELLGEMDWYCLKHGISRSELIRRAVVEYLRKPKKVSIRVRKVVLR